MKYAAILLFCFSTYGQTYLNLDFETNIYPTMNPKKWVSSGAGYRFNLDSLNAYSGEYGFKVENISNIKGAIGKVIGTLPLGFAKTNTITLKAKIKTEESDGSSIEIFISVEDEKGKNLKSKKVLDSINENSEWQEISVALYIPAEAKKVNFGGTHAGKGRTWFDNFEIQIDNTKYEETVPLSSVPNSSEIKWLKSKVVPLPSTNVEENNYSDFENLKNVFKGAKIIGLGEVTHGSKEIFEMKNRLIRYLTKIEGFETFSIEGSMPEAYEINKYVLNNKGDPQTLIGGMGFWTWYTQEMLDLVKWMNENNKKNKNKVKFTGFDMQSHKGALKNLRLMANEKVLKALDRIEITLDSVKRESKRGLNLAEYFRKDFDLLKTWYSSNLTEKENKSWFLQNITILEQVTNNYHFSQRDSYMAKNVEWIFDQESGSKLILWAHNGHIKESERAMGKYLADKYGKGYLSIGFAFHEGHYTAKGESGIKSYPAQISEPGTYEFFFNSINEPNFLLDLRDLDKNDDNQKWLFDPMRLRQTGGLKVDEEFYESSITSDFDIIIFISKSTASNLLQKAN